MVKRGGGAFMYENFYLNKQLKYYRLRKCQEKTYNVTVYIK